PIITSQDLVGAVTEQVTPTGNVSDSGVIGFTDLDLIDVHLSSPVGTPVGVTLGTLTVAKDADTTGTGTGGQLTWTYTVADSAIASLGAGQTNFAIQAGTAGSNHHGTFTLAANGNWTYSADNTQAAIQQLGAGQTLTDSFTAVSSDGSNSQLVTVTIHGTNDVPVIGGSFTGSVAEDVGVVSSHISTSGALSIADVDQGQSSFTAQASVAGTYGTFTLAANGWTYSADNTQNAIQQLGAGQSITDSFTAVSFDGTASQLVTVTIHGTNDVPVIGGVATGSVTEDVAVDGSGNLSTGGALTIADVDQSQSSFVPQPGAAGTYGTFTLDAAGNWSYTASDS